MRVNVTRPLRRWLEAHPGSTVCIRVTPVDGSQRPIADLGWTSRTIFGIPEPSDAVRAPLSSRRLLVLVTALVGWAAVAAAHPAPFSFLDLRHRRRAASPARSSVHDLDAAHELGLARRPDAARRDDGTAGTAPRWPSCSPAGCGSLIDGRPVAVTLSDLDAAPGSAGAAVLARRRRLASRPGRVTVDADALPLRRAAPDVRQRLRGRRAAPPGHPRRAPSGDGLLRRHLVRAPRRCWRRSCRPGIHHIAIGPDHILFLVGLLLLGGSLGRLGLIVTAFTRRPQRHAVAGGPRHRHPAGVARRAGDRAQHRAGRRRQPAGRPRGSGPPPRPAAVAGRRLRARPRLRVRRRAARVRACRRRRWAGRCSGSTSASSWASWRWSCPLATRRWPPSRRQRPVGRPTYRDGRLCRRCAGRGFLVRPARLLPRGHRMKRTRGVVVDRGGGRGGRGGARARRAAAGCRPQRRADRKGEGQPVCVTGGGGNTAAYVTATGVVLVDTKLANWGQPILDKVKSVTDQPVTHIINTHTHGDYVGSNEFFPASVEIVAQQNTATNMMKMDVFRIRRRSMAWPTRRSPTR